MFEKRVREKIAQLIEPRAQPYVDTPSTGRDGRWEADGHAWIAEAVNVVELALPKSTADLSWAAVCSHVGQPCRQARSTVPVAAVASSRRRRGLGRHRRQQDPSRGFFDRFLDDAVEYRRNNRKEEAGVIAGVRIRGHRAQDPCRQSRRPKGQPVENIMSALVKKEVITDEQARQARVAAFIRAKATHADWSEFSLEGVDDTIRITKFFLREHLE